MKDKIHTLFDYFKNVCESDLDWIINFVIEIISASQHLSDRSKCPYCHSSKVSSTVTQTETKVSSVMNVKRPTYIQPVR